MAHPLISSAEDALAQAVVAQAQYRQAKERLQALLVEAFARLLPLGSVVDLGARDDPWSTPWLLGAKVVRGHPRGTQVFRIDSAPTIAVDLTHPTLSTWRVEATPLSPTTGKTMSGRVHGANGARATVSLAGHVTDVPPGDDYSQLSHAQFLAIFEAARKACPQASV